jgi:hypothetical protein
MKWRAFASQFAGDFRSLPLTHLSGVSVMWAGYGLLRWLQSDTGGLMPSWAPPCLFWISAAGTALFFVRLSLASALPTVIAIIVLLLSALLHLTSLLIPAIIAIAVGIVIRIIAFSDGRPSAAGPSTGDTPPGH